MNLSTKKRLKVLEAKKKQQEYTVVAGMDAFYHPEKYQDTETVKYLHNKEELLHVKSKR